MVAKLDGIILELERQAEGLRAELQEVNGKRSEIHQALKRVQKSILMLRGRQTVGNGADLEHVELSISLGRGISKTDAMAYIAEILQSGPLTLPELRSRLGQRAKADGKALTGISMRLKHAIRSKRFEVDGDVVRLAENGQ
jgi:hypothetical protein